MKIKEVGPIIESINVRISDIEYFSEVDRLKKYQENIKEDYQVTYKGDVIFNVDYETGKVILATNVGKFKFTMGSSFFKEHFGIKQIKEINKLCKKAFKKYRSMWVIK